MDADDSLGLGMFHISGVDHMGMNVYFLKLSCGLG